MHKLPLLLGVMLIPAFGAPAMAAPAYDHPQQSAPAQFHRDIAKFARDDNNTPPAAQSQQTPVKLYRVRDDNDNNRNDKNRHDNDNNGRNNNRPDNNNSNRSDNNRHDNDRSDNNRNNNSRDWNRDHSPNTTNNTRVIIKNNNKNNNRQTSKNWRGWSKDRDIRNFRQHDFASWRGGRWQHGRHNGRDGWWWAVGNLLYFYSQPVYPYPDPYAPPVVIESASYSAGYWYYCADPSGYYPYVGECYVPWRAVPQ